MNYVILIITIIYIIIIININFFFNIINSPITLTNHVTVIYLLHAGLCQCTGRQVYLRCLTQVLGN